MALRNIRTYEDEILRKNSRIVDEINDRVKILIKDMFETMYDANGIGLAAPQVGILKRVIVVDVGENPVALINPEIVSAEGSEIDNEGCLSIPHQSGDVERPKKIVVKALDLEGKEIEIKAEDLFARALCHEIDHLNGILYIDKLVEGEE